VAQKRAPWCVRVSKLLVRLNNERQDFKRATRSSTHDYFLFSPLQAASSSSRCPNPSTSSLQRHTTHSRLSITRQNGEFEPPEAFARVRWEPAGKHTRLSDFATDVEFATSHALALRKRNLNEKSWLTAPQVLAVDLLNPTPAAYAYISASSTWT